MNTMQAIQIAQDTIEAAGFATEAYSNQSPARYLTRADRDGKIRVADHDCRHPFGVIVSIEFYDAETREMMRPRFGYEVTGMTEAEVQAIAAEAIAEFLAKADEIEDDD